MAESVFLSICILTFNRAEKLNEVLINITKQLKSLDDDKNIEILIGDNCSTDNTEGVVNNIKAAFNDVPIKYYKHKKNIGFDKNIDFLYKTSVGKYVWFLSDQVLLEKKAIYTIYTQLLKNKPSAMLFSYIQGIKDTPDNPTFNISKPIELVTDYDFAIKNIIKAPKVYIYIIKKLSLSKKDMFILNEYIGLNYYFLTLMLYIFFKSKEHSLLIYRKALAKTHPDSFNIRYSPRIFGDYKASVSLPEIINNYFYILDKIPNDVDDVVLSYLIKNKLGILNLDKKIIETEEKWVYINLKNLLFRKKTRVRLIFFLIINYPLSLLFPWKYFLKIYTKLKLMFL